jgi:hypothetical protein
MTLSERLEQAKKARLIAQGKMSAEEALKPASAPAAAADDGVLFRFEPVTVEVPSGPGVHVVADLAESSGYDVEQRSVACPNCGRPGHVDMVDLVGHRTHFSCATCGAMWHVLDEESADSRLR